MDSTGVSRNSKRMLKNTAFLYFRMLLTMLISLFTSRIILQKLGIVDYGIYQTVGGLVAILAQLQSSLSMGSSRFLTYELGRKDFKKLRDTFSTVLTVHFIIAFLVVIVAETFGLWLLFNKLVIPEERFYAAFFAFQASLVVTFFNLTQIPYKASIMSHERMGVYAYLSIVEVSLSLAIVYLISIVSFDKLIVYSLLLCIVHVSITLYYRYYCIRKFKETHYRFFYDKTIIKNVFSFSGWNFFATTSLAFSNQGITLLTNMFFGPAVVTARGLANQVNSAILQFVGNFRVAINPQIVKKQASGDVIGSQQLLLVSTKYCFFLFLIIGFPVWLVTDELLELWLGVVPIYTSSFLKIILITALVNSIDQSFFIAFYAIGRIKENSITTALFFFMAFLATYISFKLSSSPLMSVIYLLIAQIIIAFFAKPLLMKKYAVYDIKEIYSIIFKCLIVLAIAVPIPIISSIYLNSLICNKLLALFIKVFIAFFTIGGVVWTIGVDNNERVLIKTLIKEKI